MESQKLHDWLQIVGIGAVVASLVFVGMQLQQSGEIAVADVLESTATRGIEQRALTAEHADIWQRACLDEGLTAAEKVIAANIYFNYLQGSFNSWVRYQETGLGSTQVDFLVDSYAANVHRYPGFRRMAQSWNGWAELGARFGDGLAREYTAAILRRVGELEIEEPTPTADVMWCGVR